MIRSPQKKQQSHWTHHHQQLIGLGFFRITVGFMLCRHALSFVQHYWNDGFYLNKFYVPYWTWFPLPSEAMYVAVLALMMLCSGLIIIGYHTRWALVGGCSLGWFHLLLNEYWYRHNRYFLLLCLFLLCFSPSHQVLSVDSWRKKYPDIGPSWTSTLIRIQMTLIYLASAFSKTLDHDWASGKVLADRGLLWAKQLGSEASPWLVNLLSNPTLWKVATLKALSTEYFLAAALWFPQTYRLAIWIGIIFHGYIETVYSVLTFSYLTVGSYFLVISSHGQNRRIWYNPEIPWQHWFVYFLVRLDWLNRLQINTHSHRDWITQDKDQRCYRGGIAIAVAGSALILTYVIAYPITWLRLLKIGMISHHPESFQSIEEKSPSGSTKARYGLALTMFLYFIFIMLCSIPAASLPSGIQFLAFSIAYNQLTFVDYTTIFLLFFFSSLSARKI